MTSEEKVKERYFAAVFRKTYKGPAIVDMNAPGWPHIGSGDNESEAWADAWRRIQADGKHGGQ